jgi:hypothetical protein
MLDDNDANEIGDGGTSDVEGVDTNVLFLLKME